MTAIPGLGVFWSFLSALLWSTTFIGSRYLLDTRLTDPITLSVLRFAIGGAALLLVGLWRYRWSLFAISLADWGRLALLGLFGIVGMSVFLFYGLTSTTATHSVIIMQLSPIMIILLGLFIGECVSLQQVAGIVVALVGCALVVGVLTLHGIQITGGNLAGDLLVLASGFCWAVNAILGKKTSERLGGLRTTVWSMILGAVELLLLRLVLPTQIWPHGTGSWALILYLAIFPTAIAFFAWFESMRLIPLSLLNVMQYLSPPFTILLAWTLLGERIYAEAWFGIPLTLLGVMLVSWEHAPRRRIAR